MAETTAREFVTKVAEVSAAIGWQSGTGAMEMAGQIISCLYANPDAIDRFMAEGTELLLDGTLAPENGALTYHAVDGNIYSPSDLRARKGKQQ